VELTEREASRTSIACRRNVAGLQHAGVRIAATTWGAGNAGLRLLSSCASTSSDRPLARAGGHPARFVTERAARRSRTSPTDRERSPSPRVWKRPSSCAALRELGIAAGQGYLLGRPGRNVALGQVDIEALAAGALILGAPSPRGGWTPSRPGRSDAGQSRRRLSPWPRPEPPGRA